MTSVYAKHNRNSNDWDHVDVDGSGSYGTKTLRITFTRTGDTSGNVKVKYVFSNNGRTYRSKTFSLRSHYTAEHTIKGSVQSVLVWASADTRVSTGGYKKVNVDAEMV